MKERERREMTPKFYTKLSKAPHSGVAITISVRISEELGPKLVSCMVALDDKGR
jgi:hypothetical protein